MISDILVVSDAVALRQGHFAVLLCIDRDQFRSVYFDDGSHWPLLANPGRSSSGSKARLSIARRGGSLELRRERRIDETNTAQSGR